MSKASQRTKKLSAVIKVRERELNFGRDELADTRRQKQSMLAQLNKSQQTYINSVDSLNNLRMDQASTSETFAIESSIEFIRNKWAIELTEVRRLERQERIQLVMVQDLEAKVKAVEIINDKYKHEIKVERARQEQEALDEFVISRYR
jgi:hypothetical protein